MELSIFGPRSQYKCLDSYLYSNPLTDYRA
jgi:hypothetical protein